MGGTAAVVELRRNAPMKNAPSLGEFSSAGRSRLMSPIIVLAASMALVSCSGGSTRSITPQPSYVQHVQSSYAWTAKPSYAHRASRIPLGGGVRKIGKPYKVAGRWYTPRHQPRYDRVGTASWYGTQFHGKKTANGEIFDMHNLTAAHPTLPIPSYVRVTNLANRRSLILRVNDRGPYARNRIMDLSKKSAKLLGVANKGTLRVRVQYLGQAPLNGNLSRERAYLARQPWYKARYARRNAQSSWISRFALGAPPK